MLKYREPDVGLPHWTHPKAFDYDAIKKEEEMSEVTVTVGLRMVGDKVLVRADKAAEVTQGGIFLPEKAQERPVRGLVVSASKGRYNELGAFIPMDIKLGDFVMYGKYAGTEIEHQGEKYLILRESEILAVVE